MIKRRVNVLMLVVAVLCWFAGISAGDTLVLKDGTKIVGAVMQAGDRYWIDPDNGSKGKFIDSSQVKDWIKGTPAGAAGAGGTAKPQDDTGAFGRTKRKAEATIFPQDAIDIWKAFLATTPAPSDMDKRSASLEIDDLNKKVESGAEKVNGKWVTGEEKAKMMADALALYKEAGELLHAQKTLQVIPKLQEAVKAYPNYYNANCRLVELLYASDRVQDAMTYAEVCLRLRPKGIDAMNNYAVLMIKKGQWDLAISKLYEAVQIEDDEILAFNLGKALKMTPNKTSPIVAKATDASKLLSAKFDYVMFPAEFWTQVPFQIHPPIIANSDGMIVSGSGFVLNADGYILTNRHVVSKMTRFLVITADGVKMPAQVVKIDKDRDLALLKITKIDPGAHLTPVIISKADFPPEGAQVYAVGYPLIDILEITIKVTQGIISGRVPKVENGVDILTDAKVNPGNSGGPLLDKFGQVVGIITMKTITDEDSDSYGMAISGGTVKKFLADNNVKVATEDSGTALQPEDVVKKVRAGTVCILAH